MKQDELQRYIYKIHSSKLRDAKWDLTLPIQEARKNDEVIALAGSQMLRWIEELNGCADCEHKSRKMQNNHRHDHSSPD